MSKRKVKPVRAWIVQADERGNPDLSSNRLKYVCLFESDYRELLRQAKKEGKVKRAKG